jgi:hypothetical protein
LVQSSAQPSSPQRSFHRGKSLAAQIREKAEKPGLRVIFRGPDGRFVSQSARYQKATTVQRRFRKKWETVAHTPDSVITPKRLADLLPRDEFEQLRPNYSDPVAVRPAVRKYTAWDVAGQAQSIRGLRGHTCTFTLNLRDGDRLRKVVFYRRIRRRGNFQIPLFLAMNEAIGNEKMFLYNKVGSKLLPDRKGRKVHLDSIEISKEL